MLRRRGGRTVLARLRQEGCLKARFPRVLDDSWADVTTVNLSGGVAGGDQLAVQVSLQPGARATVSGQAAERFYRALPGSPPARVRTTLAVAEGGSLEWLPQESILFDRSSLDRSLDVELAADARFLGVESLVLGRAAMGETVEQVHLRDLIRVRRGGELLLHDAVRLDGGARELLARRATGGGMRAFATLTLAGPGADTLLDRVRDALAGTPAEAGASAWDGLLVARLAAADGAGLRTAVVAALAALRGGRALPRAWAC
jgi:urease accessory protein